MEKSSAPPLDQKQALAFSSAALGNVAGEYRFLNQDRRPVSLSDYRGKPLVVNFIYTSCYHICPTITSNLKSVVDVARDALGEDSFAVVTIGFDTAVDSPEALRMFAAQRGVDFQGWDFLSGDEATVAGITSDLGFSFAPSPNGFDHLAQSTILDADGRVYRQVLGMTYEPPALVEPLKELVFGRRSDGAGLINEWVDGIRLFCTIYDPTSGKYHFDYSIFLMIGIGLLCLTSIAVFLVRAWRQHRPG